MSTLSEQPFRFSHNRWSAVPASRLGDRVQIRRLRGAASDGYWLQLDAGGRLSSSGMLGECMISVCSGRITCRILGNDVELPTGHYALLPPHIPFELKAAGRAEATAVAWSTPPVGDQAPFEAV